MKGWPCRICGKVFASYGNVQQHRQVHSVVRPYICRTDSCHKSFSLLSGYQAHSRWHTNRRPYECRLCGKKFVHRNHKLSHRCGIGLRKLYYCHVCPQIFREILSLAYHVRHKHSKALCTTKRVCSKPAVSKKPKVQDLNNKKADTKILLKITAGKSMTIISPMKKSTSSHGKRKKDKAKKSKRKQKEDSPKNSIILSIKKGSVKMSSETKLKTPKQDCFKSLNGQVNRVVESCDKGSKLKMKIKTLTDKSASPLSNEIVNRYSYPSSPSHARKPKKVTTKCSSDTEHKVASVLSDSIAEESRVRNGIVIVKDKSGKFLAEQLQSTKAKKRENVFDSFSDPGLWKVLPSPRHDSSLDYLKLKLSPQKPLRLDSGIDLPCDKGRYLDVGVPGKSLKVENYSEDSDVFEASPGVDKDSDPGMQNVNDSGIEILSSSSYNRSNGNSVRSVLLDDNSPTYFPTEDSLLSLDSPVTDIHLKPDQSICAKCGGSLMETNNNTHSPRKCRCSNSLVNSPSQAPSPLKSSTHIASQDNQTRSPAVSHLLNVDISHCDDSFEIHGRSNKGAPDDSDIIVLGESDGIRQVDTKKVSEYEDVEIIRNKTQSDLKLRLKLKTRKTSVSKNTNAVKVDNDRDESIVYTEMENENMINSSEPSQTANTEPECDKRTSSEFKDDSVYSASFSGSDTAPVLTKEDAMVSYKGTELQCVTGVDFPTKSVSSKIELGRFDDPTNDFDVCHKLKAVQHTTENIKKDNELCKEVKGLFKGDNEKDLISCDLQAIDGKEQVTNKDPDKKEMDMTRKRTKSEPCEEEGKEKQISNNEIKNTPCIQFLTEDSTPNNPCKKEVKKKPLFKSKNKKQSLSYEGNDNILDKVIEAGVTTESKGHEIGQLNHVRKKKPIFKKRSCSGDSTEPGSKPETFSKLPEQVSKAGSVFLKDTHNVETKNMTDKISILPDINSGTESILVDKKPLNNDKQKPTQASDPSSLTLNLDVQGSTPQLEDSDSLLQIPCTDSKAQSTKDSSKKSCTSPLDLFQQQFLSFLSSNKDKPKDHPSWVKGKEEKTKNSPDKDYMNAEPCNEKLHKKAELCNTIDNISVTFEGNLKNKAISEQKKDKLSLKKTKPAGKEKVKQTAGNKHCINKVQSKKKDHEKEKGHKDNLFDIQNIKDKTKDISKPSKVHSQGLISFGLSNTSDKKSNIDRSHLETRTDSLSWLKIFSESIENKSAAIKDNHNSSEEITDFSADLAAINNKMDVSDDELNNLDVDHVFKSSNLASLQPIALGDRNVKKHKTQTKRPQKAKRSIGPFKGVKRDFESDSEFSDNSSYSGSVGLGTNAELDTDYNPFHDSDGDFDVGPTLSKRKGRKKLGNKHFFDDSDSDDFTNLKIKTVDEKVNSSRTKRLKQGQKSCCPCCIGSPEKISKEYHPHHAYTLPKNSKQFVKSSMKLLELQAKIHQLFLSLFPDCAEIISNSKIGTEEFEVLIDEVLGSLEDQDISFEESSVDRTHSYMEGLYTCENSEFCNTHNQIDPNDFLQTGSSFHKCIRTKENFIEKESECNTEENGECCRKGVCSSSKAFIGPSCDINKYHQRSATIDLHNPNCAIESFSGFKGAFHSVSEPDLQSPSGSFHPSLPMEPPWNDVENMSCEDASEFGVDSDITITIDLKAAKVSLCRDPKNCLERLHNRIARLVQCLLPKLKLKKTFFRNIDNLHFLLDLLITANLPGSSTNLPLSDDETDTKMIGLSTNPGVRKLDFLDIDDNCFSDGFTNANMSYKSVNLSKSEGVFSGTKLIKGNHSNPEERVPLLSKFQDEFEQEIKSHRESLKKDVFDSHTNSDNIDQTNRQTSLQKAKEVLTAIKTIETLNKGKQKPRPRRDPRLRKNEAESRKLFVQEKILNNQNSTIVCHASPKKSKKIVRKSRKKNKDSQNSKESFLSGLDLGEISPQQTQPDVKAAVQDGDETLQYNNEDTDSKQVIERSKNDMEDIKDLGEVLTHKPEGDSTTGEDSKSTLDILQSNEDVKKEPKVVENETEVSEQKDLSTADEESRRTADQAEHNKDSLVPEDPDSRQKSGEKNIFELMQPS